MGHKYLVMFVQLIASTPTFSTSRQTNNFLRTLLTNKCSNSPTYAVPSISLQTHTHAHTQTHTCSQETGRGGIRDLTFPLPTPPPAPLLLTASSCHSWRPAYYSLAGNSCLPSLGWLHWSRFWPMLQMYPILCVNNSSLQTLFYSAIASQSTLTLLGLELFPIATMCWVAYGFPTIPTCWACISNLDLHPTQSYLFKQSPSSSLLLVLVWGLLDSLWPSFLTVTFKEQWMYWQAFPNPRIKLLNWSTTFPQTLHTAITGEAFGREGQFC